MHLIELSLLPGSASYPGFFGRIPPTQSRAAHFPRQTTSAVRKPRLANDWLDSSRPMSPTADGGEYIRLP